MAPEVFKRTPYSLPVDIFSLGVLVFALISSTLPFPFSHEKLTNKNVDKFHALFQHQLEFKGETWDKISDKLKDLITNMLQKDPSKRLTIDEVLEHPWFNEK